MSDNPFVSATRRAIQKHGHVVTYKEVSNSEYDIETGSVINTDSNIVVKMYKRHIRATQYNYPDLIGKDSAMYYVYADDLTPKLRDKIVDGSDTYSIEQIVEHSAYGEVLLYKLIAVKG